MGLLCKLYTFEIHMDCKINVDMHIIKLNQSQNMMAKRGKSLDNYTISAG